MLEENANDLLSFMVVTRERNFTRAAAQLDASQSAFSHAIRHLGARLDVRLLTRTTHNAALTETGEQLIQRLGPHLEEMERALTIPYGTRECLVGNLRIVTREHATSTVF